MSKENLIVKAKDINLRLIKYHDGNYNLEVTFQKDQTYIFGGNARELSAYGFLDIIHKVLTGLEDKNPDVTTRNVKISE